MITGRKPENASPPKGARPGHVTRMRVAERRPKERTAHDPHRGRDTPDAATCRETTERPGQNARRRSPRRVDGRPLRTKRKTARVSGRRRCVGGGSDQQASAGEEATRVRRTTEAGSPGPHGSTRQARRDQRALKGTRTSREASGRSCDDAVRHLACEVNTVVTACTRPDRRLRIGFAVPERAVAGRCVEAHADADRSPLVVTRRRGPER